MRQMPDFEQKSLKCLEIYANSGNLKALSGASLKMILLLSEEEEEEEEEKKSI